ncbi:MAG TPA: hypothetical protein P5120_11820 [Spirochaetota bacterium]|nr:hypothetical protein [Spirochaetota bacterium]HPF07239.1 hypothetical protein [Spirochaetota bacterium]HPJ43576.1 hypothetical protein [Spirochaetota bacterium]HPR36546.1 hypothetical protein [Spirochaetota bacterium]HRX48197.1 hypothetical protein [Spirochaetota bacterium]
MKQMEVRSMFKLTGECKCGFVRDIECDDTAIIQKIKELPCHHCGGKIRYKSDSDE